MSLPALSKACGERSRTVEVSNLFCITAITMNIEQVKQFIKEVRWGFLATTDGRISCSTSVPVRVSVRASPCFCPCQSVFLSVPVRVYEILRRYIKDLHCQALKRLVQFMFSKENRKEWNRA